MQELAAHHQRRAGRIDRCDLGAAQQLDFAAVAVAQRTPGRSQRDAAVGRISADLRVVDLNAVGGRKVAQPCAFDAYFEPAPGIKALQRKLRHRVVGFARQRTRLDASNGLRRVLHEPPGRQGQQRHQQQWQVRRQGVAQAQVPRHGQTRHGLRAAERDRHLGQVGQVKFNAHDGRRAPVPAGSQQPLTGVPSSGPSCCARHLNLGAP